MATLTGQTIASSYQDLVKRADTYSQTGTNVELMDDSAVVKPTGLYLESGATTDNVGIGVADPDELLELYKVGTQLKLSGGAADYATFAVAADGALTITTVDADAAEADIILAPDGNVGIGVTDPDATIEIAKGSEGTYFHGGGDNASNARGLKITSSAGASSSNGAQHTIDAISSDGQLVLATNSNDALFIDNSQKVGIGTTVPYQRITLQSPDSENSYIQFCTDNENGATSKGLLVGQQDGPTGNSYIWSQQETADIIFGTKAAGGSTTERMRIDSSGNVGIGATVPASTQGYSRVLEIAGTSDTALVLHSEVGGTANKWEIGNNTSGVLQFAHSIAGDGSTGTKMVVDAAGKVGIGATSVSHTLDIEADGANVVNTATTATGISLYDTDTTFGNLNPVVIRAYTKDSAGSKRNLGLIAFEKDNDAFNANDNRDGRIVFVVAKDTSNMNEALRITSDSLITNGNNVPSTQAMSIYTSGNGSTTAEFQSTATSQSGTTAAVVYAKSDTSASANYNFYFCRASGSDEGKWDGTGRLHGQGAAVTDMDYAEYFESTDGSAIPVGTTVVLDGGKVKPSSSGETPIGVVRPYGTSSIVGGTAWNHWNKRWVTTDYDEVVFEDYETYEWYDGKELKSYETDKVPEGVTVPDDAKTVSVDLHGNKLRRRKVNPDYDPDREYEERKDRDEWNIIGLLGQVAITKGQPTASNWVKMKDISDTVEMWFVK